MQKAFSKKVNGDILQLNVPSAFLKNPVPANFGQNCPKFAFLSQKWRLEVLPIFIEIRSLEFANFLF